MKLYVKNLGNLKKANIEIKDLTVFVGKNNTNKTWTAYLIYALGSKEMLARYIVDLFIKRNSKLKRDLLSLSSLLKGTEENRKGLEKKLPFEIEEFIKKLIKDYTKFVAKYFSNFLSIPRENLKNFSCSLTRLSANKINEIKRKLLKSADEDIFTEKTDELIKNFNLLSKLLNSLVGTPFSLPAERETLTPFSIAITMGEMKTEQLKNVIQQLSKSKKSGIEKFFSEMLDLMKIKIDYNYPVPIRDFKDFVVNVVNLKEKEETLNKELTKLLEESILEGEIGIEPPGKFKYFFKEGRSLVVSVSSSMVKGLSGLDLYLKYKASPGDLLIVDEPEMNLHPEAQVRLIEFLTILANKGIKIVITTHSPYIVDHLINLMEAYKSQKENVEDKFWETKSIKDGEFKMIKPKDIFISKDSVSAYFFKEDGSVKDILNKKTGIIDWKTFSSISDKVASLYYEV